MVSSTTRVVQVSNIAPQATKDQMQTLFGYLGKIDDIRLYPTIRDVSCPVQSRICYVKYYDSAIVGVAQHLTNTVFIDRALIVIPLQSGEIPDEHKALEMLSNGTLVPGLNSVDPRLPSHVVNSLEGAPPSQVIQTHDPNLIAAGLPPYPALPVSYDSKKIEEVRRTLLVVDTGPLTHQQLIDHFSRAGEVKYVRFGERDVDKLRYCLIEMSEQESVLKGLQLNGTVCEGTLIQVQHSTQSISKPQTKSNEAAQREIEEAMYRVKEAQNLISAAIDPVIGMLSKDKRRTRSRSRSRRRSRSRSRRSRSRHRSKRRSRSRSRHRSHRRSRSRHRHRSSRSRSRHRSSRRSRSRSRHRGSKSHRSKDREDRKDKTDKEPEKEKKEKSATPPKEPVKEQKEEPKPETTQNGNSSEQVSKASTPVDDKEKEIEKEKEKEKTPEKKKKKDRSRSRDRKRDRSKSKSRRRSRSRSRRKRSKSRRRSKSREKRRSRSRDRKKSRSRDRKRSRSRDKKRSRSKERDRDKKRSKSRDKKRSRSRDRKRSRSRNRRSKSRSHRDSKTPHSRKSDRSPNLSTIEEKDVSIVNTDLIDERNSPDNMDISNSP